MEKVVESALGEVDAPEEGHRLVHDDDLVVVAPVQKVPRAVPHLAPPCPPGPRQKNSRRHRLLEEGRGANVRKLARRTRPRIGAVVAKE